MRRHDLRQHRFVPQLHWSGRADFGGAYLCDFLCSDAAQPLWLGLRNELFGYRFYDSWLFWRALPALEWSITITKAASTPYTLKIMTVVALTLVPIVLVYQAWTYWVFRKRVKVDDHLEY